MYKADIGPLSAPTVPTAGTSRLGSLEHSQMNSGHVAQISGAHGAQFMFKGGYDKVDQTSLIGKRGIGMDEDLKVM